MSLIAKSRENFEAFLLLKEHGATRKDYNFYAPAIHCCYYSCFQKMVHILKEYFTDEYERVNTKESNSHSLLISTFTDCYSNGFAENSSRVNRYLKQLKALRQRSDYGDVMVSEQEMNKASEYLANFNKIIKEDIKL
ncbi:MAG: hypothetical protein H6605_11125 [Flavobacteriales bacterium]|nr:hypothetical protein [Flavobacteriales bacterium]